MSVKISSIYYIDIVLRDIVLYYSSVMVRNFS